MNAENNNLSWANKIKYIGTGIIVGVVIAPALSKALAKLLPKVNELFDNLTGRTEAFAESASDLLARARESVSGTGKGHVHAPKASKNTKKSPSKEKNTWDTHTHGDSDQVEI